MTTVAFPPVDVLGSSVLDRAGETVGTGLPRVLAAIVLLVVGLVVVRLIGRGLSKALTTAGVDDLAERLGVHDTLERLGLDRSLSAAIASAVRIALTVTVVLAALSLTGLGFLRESLNQGVLLLPKVLVALALLLVGAVVGTFARGRVERLTAQMDLPAASGRAAEYLVLGVFALMALGQVGVSTTVLTALTGIAIVTVALALALAAGLGNREVMRNVGAGRVLRSTYEPGQELSVAGVRGEVVAFESSALVLRTAAGGTVRVPNHLVLDSIVELHGADGPGEPA